MIATITKAMVPLLTDIKAGINTNHTLARKHNMTTNGVGAAMRRLRIIGIITSERIRDPGSVTEHLIYSVTNAEYRIGHCNGKNNFPTNPGAKKKPKYAENQYSCLDEFIYKYPDPKRKVI